MINKESIFYVNDSYRELLNAVNRGVSKMRNLDRTRRRMKLFYINHTYWNIYFATFTFNKEHYFPNIASFCKYLRRNHLMYCLYPDYGEKNKRYHLHGFIVSETPLQGLKYKHNCWYTSDYYNLYGFCKLILCENEKYDSRLIKYTIKYSVKFDDNLDKKYQRLLISDRKSF